jgi:hypothetical protein
VSLPVEQVLKPKPPSPRGVALLAAIDSGQTSIVDAQFATGLTFEPAGATFIFVVEPLFENLSTIEERWTESFQRELLERGVRMKTRDEEAVRTGVHLLSNFAYADMQFGTKLTDTAVWRAISDRFTSIPTVAGSLKASLPSFEPTTKEYENCVSFVRQCIDGYGNSLFVQLKYNDPEAFGILVGGVWIVLQSRFSLFGRKRHP